MYRQFYEASLNPPPEWERCSSGLSALARVFQYGYRLPEEAPAHYVNINFRLVGPQLFTYPPVCLRNGERTPHETVKQLRNGQRTRHTASNEHWETVTELNTQHEKPQNGQRTRDTIVKYIGHIAFAKRRRDPLQKPEIVRPPACESRTVRNISLQLLVRIPQNGASARDTALK